MILHSTQSTVRDAVRGVDFCIAGAGPAGLTLARTLAASGARVALLESGGARPGAPGQILADGELHGDPYPELQGARLRGFGGTSGHWGGWCRWPLPEEWNSRPWLPQTLWPFPRSELEPFIAEAERIVGLSPAAGTAAPSWHSGPTPTGWDGWKRLATRFVSPPRRFHLRYGTEIEESDSIIAVLHATVAGFEIRNARVRAARVIPWGDAAPFNVSAPHYILAAGGIDNARMLLLSGDADGRNAPGNADSLVGTGFMDHVKFPVFDMPDAAPLRDARLFGSTREQDGILGHLALEPEVLRRQDWDLCTFELAGGPPPALGDDVVLRGLRAVHRELEGQTRMRTPAATVLMRVDPEANPNSTVRLSQNRDALGLRKARLTWQLSERERRTLAEAPRHLALAIGAAGFGSCRMHAALPGYADVFARGATYGHHHYGTTRMAEDASRGVVDPQCRVHGIANLWVAGASVMPDCAGFPTLPALALALRLARRLTIGVDA